MRISSWSQTFSEQNCSELDVEIVQLFMVSFWRIQPQLKFQWLNHLLVQHFTGEMLSFWAVGWPPLLVQSTGSIWNRLWYVIHLLQIGLVAILLKFCNMIKVPSHELFPNPPWSKYINKFSFNTKIWCVSNKMLCGGRNIYSQKEYWLLIGHARSRDLDTGLWLVRIISCCAPQEPRGWLRKLI